MWHTMLSSRRDLDREQSAIADALNCHIQEIHAGAETVRNAAVLNVNKYAFRYLLLYTS